jgi:DNA replication initiation complex subunit (GINS family)
MAREDDVTFERITRVYRDESSKKTLTALEPDFYDKVNRYLAGLETDLAAERAKDPNSKGAMLLQDELRKVLQKREQICQYRERKIALLASQRASGATVELRGLARPEQDLLQRLVDLLTGHRQETLGAPKTEPDEAPLPAGPATAGRPASPAPGAPKGVLLHILEDVPPFAGPDGTLRLKKEDLVTLPPQMAKVLVERGKARIVNAAA